MPFGVARSGASAFTVRAYLRRRTSATFDAEAGFVPAEATFISPLSDPELQPGDLIAGYLIAETLPSQGWHKYLGYRTLSVADFEGALTFALLSRQTTVSEAGGVYSRWLETGDTVRALVRELEDEPAQSGGATKRHRVLELTLEGALELDPMQHRLARDGFEYVVLEGRAHATHATAKVKEVERGYVGD